MTWYDRIGAVYLTVHVPGLTGAKMHPSKNKLSIDITNEGDEKYNINTELYSTITRESKIEVIPAADTIKVVLAKKEPGRWPRLLQVSKAPWLKVDWDHWQDEDSELAEVLKKEDEKVDDLYKKSRSFGVLVGATVFALFVVSAIALPFVLRRIHSRE